MLLFHTSGSGLTRLSDQPLKWSGDPLVKRLSLLQIQHNSVFSAYPVSLRSWPWQRATRRFWKRSLQRTLILPWKRKEYWRNPRARHLSPASLNPVKKTIQRRCLEPRAEGLKTRASPLNLGAGRCTQCHGPKQSLKAAQGNPPSVGSLS